MIENHDFDHAYDVDLEPDAQSQSPGFYAAKRSFDIVVSLALLPLLTVFAGILLVANRFGNPGPLFYVQKRMGRDCNAIRIIKFRSMVDAPRIERGADDPLETGRIGKLGRIIRKTRIDELPQIVNVLGGEMSMIGPRPDYFPHALHYLRTIPGYRARHNVAPGITGLAQVDLGYVEGSDATHAKVMADLTYARARSYGMEMKIVLKTIAVILRCRGT